MKKSLPLVLLALTAGLTVRAQWTTDLSTNTTVRAVTSGEAAVPHAADGPQGSTYVSWFENDEHPYQMRMQRLDVDGNRLWPDTGLVVSAHPQNSAVFRYDLETDGDGNAIVAFQDERTGQLDVVAYKIAPDGSFLWGADGVQLSTPGGTGLSPSVAALSNGNTAISWTTSASPAGIAAQVLAPSGAPLLTMPILITAGTALSRPVPVATSDGGFILQYVESNGGFGIPPGTMKALRYDAAGAPMWVNPVQVSPKPVAFFYFPHPVPDGHDGFYVSFTTSNPVNPNLSDVYVQRVYGNGTRWSTDGTRLDDSDLAQKFSGGKGVAWINDDDGLMVPMQVTNPDQNQSGVSVQRLDTAGVRQLGDQAVTVIPVTANAVQPWDVSATADGAVILHASGGFGAVHLAATRVALDGSSVWAPAQKDVCTANSGKDDMLLSGMQNGQIVAVWQDQRSPVGIYAQNIDSLEISTGIRPVEAANGSVRLESNPSESPVLLVDPAFGPPAIVTVFDAQGKQVFNKALATSPRMRLPLENAAPGMYTIRVNGKDQVGTLRWVK